MSTMTTVYAAARADAFDQAGWDAQRAMSLELLQQAVTALGGGGGSVGIVLRSSPLIDSFVEAGLANTPRQVFLVSLKVMWAVFYAEPTNTKDILIGGATVAASGVPVSPGQSYALPASFDIHQLYVTSTANFQYRVLFAAAPV